MVLFSLLAGTAIGGLHPLHTLVVVNDASADSQALGLYYQQQRGLPERNVCHIDTTMNYNIAQAPFSNEIRNVIFDYIDDQGLSNQITTIVLSRDIPYRVFDTNNPTYDINSTTAALYYDYHQSPMWCSIPAYTTNDYYAEERAFDSDLVYTNKRNYICGMITSWALDDSLTLIDRSVLADASSPSGTVYLLHTTDAARNVQWTQFDGADYACRFLDIPQTRQIIDANGISGKSNVVGYTAGRESLTSTVYTLEYVYGALGDSLTSSGGNLFDPGVQMSILHWLKAGCVGAYGTCVEPCNYTQKFPATMIYFWYGRGFSYGESLNMSVKNPYQGVMGGDPLCAPYAVTATVSIAGIEQGATYSNNIPVVITAIASDARHPLDQLDGYIDGLFRQTFTNLLPAIGNTVSVTIDSTTRTATVLSGDSLYDITERLENKINGYPLQDVKAVAVSDRITVSQKTLGLSASGKSISATTAAGSATQNLLFAYVTHTNFLEAHYSAMEQLYLSGTPSSGDVVRTVITTLDTLIYTNEVTAGTGDTVSSLISDLMTEINANTNLQTVTGCEAKYKKNSGSSYSECWLVARTNTYAGTDLYVDFQVIPTGGSSLANTSFSDYFDDNADDMKGKAMVFLGCGKTNLSDSFMFNTTQYADGPHVVHAVAREGTAVGSFSSKSVEFYIRNTDISCTITSPVNMANLATGTTFSVYVNSTSASTTITGLQLFAGANLVGETNAATATFSLQADTFGPGIIHVQAKALATNGTAALSELLEIRIYQDIDNDGLPGWWEYEYFGGITNALPTSDPDLDTADNLAEYIAATIPTNQQNVFELLLTSSVPTNIVLEFTSSTQRFYNIYLRSMLTTGAWNSAESNAFRGDSPQTIWTDENVSTNTRRFYRVKAIIP